jgi:hypothetical protein
MNNKDEIETETSEMVEAVFFCYYDGTNADGTIDETHFTWDNCSKLEDFEWDSDSAEDERFFDLKILVDARLFAEAGTPAHDEFWESEYLQMWNSLNQAWREMIGSESEVSA